MKMKKALSSLLQFRKKHIIVTDLIGSLSLIIVTALVTLVIQEKFILPMKTNIADYLYYPELDYPEINVADYSYYPELDYTELNGVEVYSTAMGNDIYGEYAILSSTKGVICIGNAFASQALAYRYPLILSLDESYGAVGVQLSNVEEDDSFALQYEDLMIGKFDMYQLKYDRGFIYVIVKDKNK